MEKLGERVATKEVREEFDKGWISASPGEVAQGSRDWRVDRKGKAVPGSATCARVPEGSGLG